MHWQQPCLQICNSSCAVASADELGYIVLQPNAVVSMLMCDAPVLCNRKLHTMYQRAVYGILDERICS